MSQLVEPQSSSNKKARLDRSGSISSTISDDSSYSSSGSSSISDHYTPHTHEEDEDGSPPTSTTTTTTGSPIYNMIRRDIEAQGNRFLLPFLSTPDLLRLSESCRVLLPYRKHLQRVKIVNHPTPTTKMKLSLVKLLAEQETGKMVVEEEEKWWWWWWWW